MINLKLHTEITKDALGQNIARAESIIDELATDPMAGWLTLPSTYDAEEYERIKLAATEIQNTSKYLVCIGIGGSYLGHRAIIDALGQKSGVKVLYAGNSLSTIELQKVLDELGDADFSVNIISKSGTTTEPAIAFRIFRQMLIDKYGEAEAYTRIYATTDAEKGALHDEAVANGYKKFIVPDNIGGRYSVLTAVGLLPLAVAGIDLDALMAGAKSEQDADHTNEYTYAALRHFLYENGYDTEILSSFEPTLHYFIEWWKQLYGESEGKESQGIFPTGTVYTTDLHSLGQFIQDGRPNMFETILTFAPNTEGSDATPVGPKITIPKTNNNLDQLQYLEGKDLRYINKQAELATLTAHAEARPVAELSLTDLSEYTLGELIYFFELSCALSAKLHGVNPFNQPGVDTYKNEMFRLLDKPTV